eukprot:TRINITY_DN12498_c0_g1_i1.p4 TRINITY_DN12498_c0_g1~~TRINITY_DN12498_c0_g1_i1.p4  ORF type:complete len:100 (-),score=9.30 TRINITY_DN12498_c0_g1_i1:116-415(-)
MLLLLCRLDGGADANETENDGPPPVYVVEVVGDGLLTTVGDGTVNLLLFSITLREELERLLGSVSGELLLLPLLLGFSGDPPPGDVDPPPGGGGAVACL